MNICIYKIGTESEDSNSYFHILNILKSILYIVVTIYNTSY